MPLFLNRVIIGILKLLDLLSDLQAELCLKTSLSGEEPVLCCVTLRADGTTIAGNILYVALNSLSLVSNLISLTFFSLFSSVELENDGVTV